MAIVTIDCCFHNRLTVTVVSGFTSERRGLMASYHHLYDADVTLSSGTVAAKQLTDPNHLRSRYWGNLGSLSLDSGIPGTPVSLPDVQP